MTVKLAKPGLLGVKITDNLLWGETVTGRRGLSQYARVG
jgi:hypothetical protein